MTDARAARVDELAKYPGERNKGSVVIKIRSRRQGPHDTRQAGGRGNPPHALEFDSKGRPIVADHHNHRIQTLSKDGKFVREYDDFGRTSGLAIDMNDDLHSGGSRPVHQRHAVAMHQNAVAARYGLDPRDAAQRLDTYAACTAS